MQRMNQPTIFSSGQELASLVVSSGVLRNSWDGISEVYGDMINQQNPTLPFSIRYKVKQNSHNNATIIAFVSSSPCTSQHLQGEGQCLVSSEALRESFPIFEFVSTKSNPSFSLHRAAVALFSSIQDDLSVLKQQHGKASPLIITGHSIGGSVASLFTLWLLKTISPTATKRPICITFGSPLLGDNFFQQAILERPMWNSCFLHVASNQDPIPKLLAVPHNVYKPFGAFLLCSESGFACFDEPESVLELMVAIGLDSVGNTGPYRGSSEIVDYGEVLRKLKFGAICRGVSEVGESYSTALETGIVIQIEAVKCDRTQRIEEDGELNDLIKRAEKRSRTLLLQNRSVFNPKKKLNDMKINMTYLEWYKKQSMARGGYYDAFKNIKSRSREEIVKRKNILTQYWLKEVKEAEKKPQIEGAHFHTGWLYGGTNYRRMVEPLDIADWYKKGNTNYLAVRSEHYRLLEEWVARDDRTSEHRNDRACSLTEDSCFWARVEEAEMLCGMLKAGGGGREYEESVRGKLREFEEYVKELIDKFAVSTEIFLKQSSFMLWWEGYEKIVGRSCDSWLVDFMRNRKYEQYC